MTGKDQIALLSPGHVRMIAVRLIRSGKAKIPDSLKDKSLNQATTEELRELLRLSGWRREHGDA